MNPDLRLQAAAAAAADPRSPETSGVLRMLAGGLLLGTVGVFVEEAGQHPLTAVWARCVFGAAALLAWGLARGRTAELRLSGRGWIAAFGAGVLMCLNWGLFFAAIQRMPIGVATVVFHVQPFWVMAMAALLLGEPVGRARIAAAALALVGLALASGLASPGSKAGDLDAAYGAGLLMCLGGSLSYAGVTMIAKAACGVSSFALAWWQCVVGAVLLSWWPLGHGVPPDLHAWLWLAGLGVVHTALAYVLLYAGMSRLRAERIALLQFAYPAAAVLVDWAVYGRALDVVQLAGVALMGLAIWRGRA